MKKVTHILMFVIGCATFASAQNNEFEYIKTQFHADKKTLLMHYLALSDSQAAKFWPIYDKYESERSALANQRFENIKTYAAQYKTMTNEQADVAVRKMFDAREKEMSIEKKYYGQFKKAVGARVATSWLQFEEYIDAAIRFKVLDSVPFLNEK